MAKQWDIDIRLYDIDGRAIVLVSGISLDQLEQNPKLAEQVKKTCRRVIEGNKALRWDLIPRSGWETPVSPAELASALAPVDVSGYKPIQDPLTDDQLVEIAKQIEYAQVEPFPYTSAQMLFNEVKRLRRDAKNA